MISLAGTGDLVARHVDQVGEGPAQIVVLQLVVDPAIWRDERRDAERVEHVQRDDDASSVALFEHVGVAPHELSR